MSDLVASRAADIINHMNKDHENSLKALVLHNNKQLEHPPCKAKMTSIDANGFTIEYRYVRELFWNASGEKKRQRITFTPAIKSASEVRPQIVALSKEAESGLPKKYPIKYAMPRDLFLWIGIFISFILLSSPKTASKTPSQVQQIVRFIHTRAFTSATASLIFKGLVGAHIAEALLMTVYVNSRGASLATTLKWAVTHFFIGFPTYFAFQKLNPEVPRLSKK